MSFSYRNPTSPVVLQGADSVSLENNTGTNFSVYSIGGYMEVYSHADLDFIIPEGSSGSILYSGNTIPINFVYGDPLSFPNAVNIETDQISCGRRRLGVLLLLLMLRLMKTNTVKNTVRSYTNSYNQLLEIIRPLITLSNMSVGKFLNRH